MATRASVPVTLADLFGAGNSRGLAGRELADGDKQRLSSALKVRPRVAVADVEGEMASAYASALGTRLIDIFLGGWTKLSEVCKFADEPSNKRGERHLVPLAKHTISSRHEPKLEVLVDNVPALQIPVEVKLAADFEAAVLAVEAGQIFGIRAGSFRATGSVSCRGVPLSTLNSQWFQLPAEIELSPPFRIPRFSADKPATMRADAMPNAARPQAVRGEGHALLLSGKDDSGQPLRFVLKEPSAGQTVWTIGRRPGRSDILIGHKSVSGEHARVRAIAGRGIEVCDLGSSNGTFVDGRRIGSEFVPIDGARMISLGGCEFGVARG